MLQTTTPKRGILTINWKRWGWNETFDFPDLTMTVVQGHMANLAALRAFLLPADAQIAYGRVAMPGHSRQTVLAIPAPIAGHSADLTTPPDNFLDSPNTALLFRLDGESFFKGTMHIKALPDNAVQDMTLQFAAPGGAWVTAYGGSPPAVATSATWAAGLKKLFDYYVSVCTLNRKGIIDLGGGNTGPGYNCAQISMLSYRKVSSVKVGRPFDSPRARSPRR